MAILPLYKRVLQVFFSLKRVLQPLFRYFELGNSMYGWVRGERERGNDGREGSKGKPPCLIADMNPMFTSFELTRQKLQLDNMRGVPSQLCSLVKCRRPIRIETGVQLGNEPGFTRQRNRNRGQRQAQATEALQEGIAMIRN